MRQRRAALYKTVSTIGYAGLPIALALLPHTPHFAAAWRAGVALAFTAYLTLLHSSTFFNTRTWRIILPRLASPHVTLTLASRFDTWLFVLATSYVSIATAAIIAEASTLLFILNMTFLHRRHRQYQQLIPADIIPAILAFTGFILASSAETGQLPNPAQDADIQAIMGIALALASAIIGAAQANSFIWAHRTADLLSAEHHQGNTLFASVSIAAIADLAVAAVTFFPQRQMPIHTPAAYPIAAGALAFGVAGVTSRKANIIASNFSVNLISFARPLIILPTLSATTGLSVASPLMLVAGAALIVIANIIAALRAAPAETSA